MRARSPPLTFDGLVGEHHDEQLPLVAFRLVGDHGYDEVGVASQLAAERGWMVPAYTLPPSAEHVTILRAMVEETLGQSLVESSSATSRRHARRWTPRADSTRSSARA